MVLWRAYAKVGISEIWAIRRYNLLIDSGEMSIYPQILKDIKLRDKKDKTRINSPLVILFFFETVHAKNLLIQAKNITLDKENQISIFKFILKMKHQQQNQF